MHRSVKMLTSKTRRNLKNLMLISVNVVGSAGPIRFIVNEDDLVTDVVRKALKIYGREGRLPILGFDVMDFILLCPTADSEVLNPSERINSCGARNFLLCKSSQLIPNAGIKKEEVVTKNAGKRSGAFKSWINKSLRIVISAQ